MNNFDSKNVTRSKIATKLFRNPKTNRLLKERKKTKILIKPKQISSFRKMINNILKQRLSAKQKRAQNAKSNVQRKQYWQFSHT